jgi:hypothetical protein
VQVTSDIGDPAVIIDDVMMGSRSIVAGGSSSSGGMEGAIAVVATTDNPWLDPQQPYLDG